MRKEGRPHLTALFVCTVTSGFLSDFDQSRSPQRNWKIAFVSTRADFLFLPFESGRRK